MEHPWSATLCPGFILTGKQPRWKRRFARRSHRCRGQVSGCPRLSWTWRSPYRQGSVYVRRLNQKEVPWIHIPHVIASTPGTHCKGIAINAASHHQRRTHTMNTVVKPTSTQKSDFTSLLMVSEPVKPVLSTLPLIRRRGDFSQTSTS